MSTQETAGGSLPATAGDGDDLLSPRRPGSTDGEGAKLTAPAPSPRTSSIDLRKRNGSVYRVLFDEDDTDLVCAYRWNVLSVRTSYTHYALSVATPVVLMHRLFMNLKPGDPLRVDHINGDGLDNRRANLRHATNAENMRNRIANKKNPTGFKGVAPSGKKTPWVARIGHEGRNFHLGHFHTAEEAALAYNEAATRLHGKFARLNVIPEPSASARLNGMTGAQA